jgi:hypothetical protein
MLFLGSAPVSALMNEGSSEKDFSGSGLSTEARRNIESFLVGHLRAKKISLDLVPVILARIDEYASGGAVSEPDIRPRVIDFPSVAQQIVWQSGLNDIAADFRRRFPAGDTPRPSHIVMEDEPRRLPNHNEILWFAPTAIGEAQGALSEALNKSELMFSDQRKGGQLRVRRTLGHYTAPVRIAPTGIAIVDEAIPLLLAGMQGAHRDLMLDQKSFPSTVSDANLIIPEERYGGDAVAHAIYCVRDRNCRSLADLAQPSAKRGRLPEDEGRNFLDSIYFANPYGARRASRVLVRLNENGSIAEAYCSLDDIGFDASKRMLRDDGETLKICLEAAMGY